MIDTLMDWVVAMALWGMQRLYPLLRSKTGYDNPRTRHITGLSYPARICWMVCQVRHMPLLVHDPFATTGSDG